MTLTGEQAIVAMELCWWMFEKEVWCFPPETALR
jgi:hypothetical protein